MDVEPLLVLRAIHAVYTLERIPRIVNNIGGKRRKGGNNIFEKK